MNTLIRALCVISACAVLALARGDSCKWVGPTTGGTWKNARNWNCTGGLDLPTPGTARAPRGTDVDLTTLSAPNAVVTGVSCLSNSGGYCGALKLGACTLVLDGRAEFASVAVSAVPSTGGEDDYVEKHTIKIVSSNCITSSCVDLANGGFPASFVVWERVDESLWTWLLWLQDASFVAHSDLTLPMVTVLQGPNSTATAIGDASVYVDFAPQHRGMYMADTKASWHVAAPVTGSFPYVLAAWNDAKPGRYVLGRTSLEGRFPSWDEKNVGIVTEGGDFLESTAWYDVVGQSFGVCVPQNVTCGENATGGCGFVWNGCKLLNCAKACGTATAQMRNGTCQFNKTGGDWNDASNWDCGFVPRPGPQGETLNLGVLTDGARITGTVCREFGEKNTAESFSDAACCGDLIVPANAAVELVKGGDACFRSLTLGPYASLTLNSDNLLRCGSTDFVFGEIRMEATSRLVLNAVAIRVISGDFSVTGTIVASPGPCDTSIRSDALLRFANTSLLKVVLDPLVNREFDRQAHVILAPAGLTIEPLATLLVGFVDPDSVAFAGSIVNMLLETGHFVNGTHVSGPAISGSFVVDPRSAGSVTQDAIAIHSDFPKRCSEAAIECKDSSYFPSLDSSSCASCQGFESVCRFGFCSAKEDQLTCTWIGSPAGGSWANASNWDCGRVPLPASLAYASGDQVVIDCLQEGAVLSDVVCGNIRGGSCGSLDWQGSMTLVVTGVARYRSVFGARVPPPSKRQAVQPRTLTVQGGGHVYFSEADEIPAGSVLNVLNGTTVHFPTLLIGGALRLSGAGSRVVTSSGPVRFASGSMFRLEITDALDPPVVVSFSEITIDGSLDISVIGTNGRVPSSVAFLHSAAGLVTGSFSNVTGNVMRTSLWQQVSSSLGASSYVGYCWPNTCEEYGYDCGEIAAQSSASGHQCPALSCANCAVGFRCSLDEHQCLADTEPVHTTSSLDHSAIDDATNKKRVKEGNDAWEGIAIAVGIAVFLAVVVVGALVFWRFFLKGRHTRKEAAAALAEH